MANALVRGCIHARLVRLVVGTEQYAFCKACRRTWVLLEGGKK